MAVTENVSMAGWEGRASANPCMTSDLLATSEPCSFFAAWHQLASVFLVHLLFDNL